MARVKVPVILKRTTWVRVDITVQAIVCDNCGAKKPLAKVLPCDAAALVYECAAFAAKHAACPTQMDLLDESVAAIAAGRSEENGNAGQCETDGAVEEQGQEREHLFGGGAGAYGEGAGAAEHQEEGEQGAGLPRVHCQKEPEGGNPA